MQLKLSVNFSFGNLSRRINKITENYVEEFAKSSEKISKQTIDSGKLKKLKNSTIKLRKSKGQPESPPLKATGKLYDSIKAEGSSLNIIQYGKWHNDGAVPTTVARPFISGLSISNVPERKKLDKKLIKNINKALRIKERVVLLK
jgi:hypothetical protein